MALFEWSDSYSVGVVVIDEQHRKLVALLNALHESMLQGTAHAELAAILRDLVAYTDYHFSTEEDLMREAVYPSYLAHKVEHDALRRKALALVADSESGKLTVTVALAEFLREWLAQHIQGTDRRLGAFLGGRSDSLLAVMRPRPAGR